MNANEFQRNAMRTKSDQFNRELVSNQQVLEVLGELLVASRPADKLKKALFYGKPHGLPLSMGDEGHALISMSPEMQSVLHGILGLMTETDELVCPFAGAVAGAVPLDRVNVMEECGDVLWYVALILDAVGYSMEECMDRVIAKLQVRFPEKFTQEAVLNRDLDGERAALEG